MVVIIFSLVHLVSTWWSSEAPCQNNVTQAYIGPGAGIALVGSFLVILTALLSALFTIFTWPLRRVWRAVRGRRALRNAKVKRVVVLGLDGLEPDLTEQLLEEGLLPNLASLKEKGGYGRLGTTWPPLSPVAWSSFSTGTNPGKHNIYDFIRRNPKTYQPDISSVRIGRPRRELKFGKYVFPLSRPEITSLRKSRPVWSVLGEAGVFSAVLRVPITFPPDRFHGVQLSAMCVPDLLGTQGTYLYFSERDGEGSADIEDGVSERILVERHGNDIHSYVRGPENPFRNDKNLELRVPFRITPSSNGCSAILNFQGQRIPLQANQYTDWVRFSFKAAPGVSLRGVARFYLKRYDRESFEMYSTPIQIDPDKPVMPIAHPIFYSSYLARQQGIFSTLGLAEDTNSLSDGLMTEDAFLEQAYAIHQERETMFHDALRKVRQGLIVCVFDAPDRIQHMFWRFHDQDHPAMRDRPNTHPLSIRDMYIRMDKLVGETLDQLDDETALLVMSDHGFKSFRHSVDLNTWLLENGYLQLKDGARRSTRTYLKDVDWSRTRAYAVGLAGIYLNLRGREAQGIVNAGAEKEMLIAEISKGLHELIETASGEKPIREAAASSDVYRGPYVEAAPDIIVGYNSGYRVSWESAVGKTSGVILSENQRAWSGDHCVHPDVVPGVFFSSLNIHQANAKIIDLAPTILDLLGVEKPSYMDGESLL